MINILYINVKVTTWNLDRIFELMYECRESLNAENPDLTRNIVWIFCYRIWDKKKFTWTIKVTSQLFISLFGITSKIGGCRVWTWKLLWVISSLTWFYSNFLVFQTCTILPPGFVITLKLWYSPNTCYNLIHARKFSNVRFKDENREEYSQLVLDGLYIGPLGARATKERKYFLYTIINWNNPYGTPSLYGNAVNYCCILYV